MPEISRRRVFPGEEHQVAVLREWLTSLLPARPELGDLVVVATEMVNNAIRHTASGRGGRFTVEVTCHPAAVRVAVTDGGAPDGPHLIHDPLSENGRGLRLIWGMSARSGVCGDPAGRQVWAEIPWGDAAVAEPSAPQTAEEAIQAGLAERASRFAGYPSGPARPLGCGGHYRALTSSTTRNDLAKAVRAAGPCHRQPTPRPTAARAKKAS